MSGVDGKKLKLHLGALKQSLDDIIINTSTASTSTTTSTTTGTSTTSTIHKLFQLILITELAQRGIVIPYSADSDNDEDTDDIVLLWNGITSTAGRECLNNANVNANVKPPLIAGAAIVSALAVQKMSRALQNVHVHNMESHNNKLITMTMMTCMCMKQTEEMEMEAAYRRCIAVEDERLATLLNIGIQAGIIPVPHMNMNMNINNNKGPPGPPPGPPIAEEEEIIVNLPAVILACHQITRGNYQRASSYSNRDAPPLFKKTLESVLNYQHAMDYFVQVQVATATANEYEYEYDDEDKSVEWREDGSINDYTAHETPMTIEPLLNLRRIAAMKQNHKRSSELSLRLVQAYLNLSNNDNDDNGDNDKENLEKYILTTHAWKNLWEGMMEAFVHQSMSTDTDTDTEDGDDTHTKNKKGKKLQLQVELAREMLDSFDLSLFDNDDDDDGQEMMILYHLLKVRVGMQTEETIVKTIGGKRYTTSRNRTGIGMGIGIGSSAASTTAKPSTSTSTGGGKSKTFKKKVIASVKKTAAPLPTTREGCEDMVRRELLSYTLSQDDIDSVPVEYSYESESKGEKMGMEEAAVVLRDVYLQKYNEGEGSVSNSYASLIDHVCICLQQHIERLVLRAQSIMRLNRKKKKTRDVKGMREAWRAVLEHITPLSDLRDESDRDGIWVVIELKRDAVAAVVQVSE